MGNKVYLNSLFLKESSLYESGIKNKKGKCNTTYPEENFLTIEQKFAKMIKFGKVAQMLIPKAHQDRVRCVTQHNDVSDRR